MDEKREKLMNIAPMRQYEPPKVPTLNEIRKDSAPLKKLPKRWLKNAATLAGIGMLSLAMLAGCADNRYGQGEYGLCGQAVGYSASSSHDMVFRLDHGGAVSANYIVHLTEQEVFGIILRGLEAAGLHFSDVPCDYVVYPGNIWSPPIVLALLDEERNVGISHLDWGYWRPSSVLYVRSDGEARWREPFSHEQVAVTVGVFYTPQYNLNTGNSPNMIQRAIARRRARPVLEAAIEEQIEDFIALLRHQGIIN